MSYRRAWGRYCAHLDELAAEIITEAPAAGDGALDGRCWCEENDVPERMFAHAVEHASGLDYGVSPMHPWVIDDE